MSIKPPSIYHSFHEADAYPDDTITSDDEDLWFLPGPSEDEPDVRGPAGDPVQDRIQAPLHTNVGHPSKTPASAEVAILTEWQNAEAALAVPLAHAAGCLGGLNDRLQRSPAGWRHRLALIEAVDLSWFVGTHVTADRLALWITLRLSGVQHDIAALTRAQWAARHLTSGAGPEQGLAAFLDRRDLSEPGADSDSFADREANWQSLMRAGQAMHPISRACMGYHLWDLAGLDPHDDKTEAAVTAGRVAAGHTTSAVFAPLAMGGAKALRSHGSALQRLTRWLEGLQSATLTAMRHLDEVEAWSLRADQAMQTLSGRTPPALRMALMEWPLISAPMAEALTGASRASAGRNLAWMENHGLIREITGHSRFRLWTIKR